MIGFTGITYSTRRKSFLSFGAEMKIKILPFDREIGAQDEGESIVAHLRTDISLSLISLK